MKQLKITVNGRAYDVQVEEVGTAVAPAAVAVPAAPASVAAPAAPAAAPAPVAAPAAPAPVATTGEGETIVAPMPGSIIKILVSAGTAVKKGEAMLIFEAMKMENEICAPKDGVVTSVMVNSGETIDSGKALFTLK